ncbi:hypothetical protein [Streptomyces sp. H39-C1]|uniref:hypothetical protein n=1 Tax=Streptomyces sp. H39-C1 TaxID=3004355 RepID=UPI0022AF7016|nr:hypothetical protein [Streptomyces sp. H39-C1]MCZ4098014.1 hypothetical protein [Streptomyces sp. H39-C1]
MSSQAFRPAEVSLGLDYVEFDARLARDGECKTVVKATYMALATFADTDEHTTMSPATLAGLSEEARRALLPYRSSIGARVGRSVDTVDKANRELVERGLLLIAPQGSASGERDANVYHLTDREQWARRVLERAQLRDAALAAGQPWPARSTGPYVPRVRRDPGFDFIKLDAPTVANGAKSPNYKAVYAAVATFVHGKQRTSSDRPPTYKELCASTGLGRSTVAANISEMADDGLLLITERYDEENGGRLASAYTLMDGKWWAQRALKRMRDAEEEHIRENDLAEGVAAPAGRGWPHELDGGGRTSWTGVAAPAGPHYKKVFRSRSETGLADAVGKPAGGFARAGARDGAAAETGTAGGGCAASPPAIPPQPQRQASRSPGTKTLKTSPRKSSAGFEMVRAAIPPEVARPGTRLYPGLHRAINDLLCGNSAAGIPRRTPEQVIARLNRRWFGMQAAERSLPTYRGCARCTTSGCKAARRNQEHPEGCDRIINRCSWLAAALLEQDCPDPACEDGVLLDSGTDCPDCEQRKAERRAVERVRVEAEERMARETETSAGRQAAHERHAEAAAAEEYRVGQALAATGAFGRLLEHQIRQHMAAWRDRNLAPGSPPGFGRHGVSDAPGVPVKRPEHAPR